MARGWAVAALGVALLAGATVVAMASREYGSAAGPPASRVVIPGLAADSQPTNTPTPTPIFLVTQTPTNVPPLTPSPLPSVPYVAFASGLASTFTKGGICSLDVPFVLEGDAPPVSSGFVGSFAPSNSTGGAYTFTNNILDGACVDSSSGTYEVIFYGLGEGDIILTGHTTRICGPVTVFAQTTESRVAIREEPSLACP